MPIYAYKCSECGHDLEAIQKMSDKLLTDCPNCGKPGLVKQVTAAGVQLKGSGWYVTDFRDGGTGKKKDGVKTDEKAKTEQTDSEASAKGDVKADTKTEKTESGGGAAADSQGSKAETKTDSSRSRSLTLPLSQPLPPRPHPRRDRNQAAPQAGRVDAVC